MTGLPGRSFAPTKSRKGPYRERMVAVADEQKRPKWSTLRAWSPRAIHLGRGFELAANAPSERFTVFDGWIPEPGPELEPDILCGADGLGQQARNPRPVSAQVFLPVMCSISSRPTS